MALNSHDDYRVTCDNKGCEEEFDRPEGLTVQWANVMFCSPECRDEWSNSQVNHELL